MNKLVVIGLFAGSKPRANMRHQSIGFTERGVLPE
jgi:hypothetical protein